MLKSYSIFISYSSRYRDWVENLRQNLEKYCLINASEFHDIVLDETDLGAGQSWMARLQEGLVQWTNLILIVTPETLALPAVTSELKKFIEKHDDWQERLHIALLIHTPLPPFLSDLNCIDFRDHDDNKYLNGLRKLVACLPGSSKLPKGVDIPEPPSTSVPWKIRARLIAWLANALKDKVRRHAIADILNFEITRLAGHPSWACAASAVLVLATGKDDPPEAALRIADALYSVFEKVEPEELSRVVNSLRAVVIPGSGRGLLGAYMRMVERHNSDLILFAEEPDPTLVQQMFLQIDMRLANQEVRQDVRLALQNRRLSIRELLELDPDRHSWVTRRWIIHGDPGSGKTTLLRHLAWRLTRESQPRWVPVLESLPRLVREQEWLFDRIAREFRAAGHPAEGLLSVLKHEAQRLLVLLDDLDEVPGADLKEVKNLLDRLSATWPQATIVVATRIIGYHKPAFDFREVELLPLVRGSQKDFLAGWFKRQAGTPDPKRAESILRSLESDPGLQELASNPLYLTLMARLIEKGKPPNRHRPLLYEDIFKVLMNGILRVDGTPIELEPVIQRVLRHLAYAMTDKNRYTEPVKNLESKLKQEKETRNMLRILQKVPRWKHSLSRFFDDLARKTGILGPHDGPNQDWRFLHRSFREAHTAQELYIKLEDEGMTKFLERVKTIKGHESQWAEPYSLLAGRVANPDDLVRTLVEVNPPLGMRAMATAQCLKDETMIDILKLTDDWRERRNVYQRVPDLVGDAKPALVLLNQLSRRTRNGNDLFFIDQAVSTIARRWSQYEQAAKKLCLRLYDHISAPPEDLFRQTVTAVDGPVELWREIPAGEFIMGSAEAESEESDEKPRHSVMIESAFRFAATLVTNAQYACFDPNHDPGKNLSNYPVVNVTSFEAISFCRWLSVSLPWARGARLPLEEEWEYCCRAGTKTRYWSGDRDEDLDRVAWHKGNSDSRIRHVGEKPQNPWGIYDIHGNVWEWTLGRRDSYETRKPGFAIDPSTTHLRDLDLANVERCVTRGGSAWDEAQWTRSAYRGFWEPEVNDVNIGFRLVLPKVA